MQSLLFIYNLLLTVTMAAIMSGYYFLNHHRKEKKFALVSILFLLLVVDHGHIYFSEFALSHENYIKFQSTIIYGMDIIYLGVLFILRYLYGQLYKTPINKLEIGLFTCIPLALLTFTQLVSVHVGDFLITIALYSGVAYIASKYYSKNVIGKGLLLFVILACFTATGDAYILSFGIDFKYLPFIDQLVLRDISFDMIKLVISFVALKYLKNQFDQVDFHPKAKEMNHSHHSDNLPVNLPTNNQVLPLSPAEKLEKYCAKHDLTQRQKEIVMCIMEGQTNKEISQTLHITEGTVKTHIYNIFKKTGATNRNQVVSGVHSTLE